MARDGERDRPEAPAGSSAAGERRPRRGRKLAARSAGRPRSGRPPGSDDGRGNGASAREPERG
ncbi:MAG: hypothetical protein ABR599_11135, partial [Gemmatimonadota bacterium]